MKKILCALMGVMSVNTFALPNARVCMHNNSRQTVMMSGLYSNKYVHNIRFGGAYPSGPTYLNPGDSNCLTFDGTNDAASAEVRFELSYLKHSGDLTRAKYVNIGNIYAVTSNSDGYNVGKGDNAIGSMARMLNSDDTLAWYKGTWNYVPNSLAGSALENPNTPDIAGGFVWAPYVGYKNNAPIAFKGVHPRMYYGGLFVSTQYLVDINIIDN